MPRHLAGHPQPGRTSSPETTATLPRRSSSSRKTILDWHRHDRQKDYVFDLDRMVQFEGTLVPTCSTFMFAVVPFSAGQERRPSASVSRRRSDRRRSTLSPSPCSGSKSRSRRPPSTRRRTGCASTSQDSPQPSRPPTTRARSCKRPIQASGAADSCSASSWAGPWPSASACSVSRPLTACDNRVCLASLQPSIVKLRRASAALGSGEALVGYINDAENQLWRIGDLPGVSAH